MGLFVYPNHCLIQPNSYTQNMRNKNHTKDTGLAVKPTLTNLMATKYYSGKVHLITVFICRLKGGKDLISKMNEVNVIHSTV